MAEYAGFFWPEQQGCCLLPCAPEPPEDVPKPMEVSLSTTTDVADTAEQPKKKEKKTKHTSDKKRPAIIADAGSVIKPKRKRPVEFAQDSGEWVDVRRFDRMPVTVEEAEETEASERVPPGTYFVSLAHKRMAGIVQLHGRWLMKTKNQCSEYAAVQKDLMDFFTAALVDFECKYSMYTNHPRFDSIGKTRKRVPHAKKTTTTAIKQ